MRDRIERPLAFLALAAAVWAVYFIILSAPVFSYDDLFFVRDNPIYRLTFADFWRQLASLRYLPFAQERTYQPLTTLLHFPIFLNPAAYRAAGICFHAANACLVYELGRRLSLRSGPALAAALLFALFPANTEAVDISIFKGHLLAFFFALLTLLCWIEAARRSSKTAWLILACASFIAGLLSKETGLLALALVGAYAVFFGRERLSWHGSRGAVLILLAAAYLWFRFRLLAPGPPLPADQLLPWSSTLPFSSFSWYLKTLLVPYPLCLMHSINAGSGMADALMSAGRSLLVALYFYLLWRLRSRPGRAFLLLWLLLALIPYLHLVPFAGYALPSASYSYVSDRYLYSASAGFCLLLAGLLYETRARSLLAALALCWGLISLQRNGLYRDWGGLCRQSAACAPLNAAAHIMLGGYYYDHERDYPKALSCYRTGFALQPGIRTQFKDPGLVHSQGAGYVLGLIRYKMGDLPEAERMLSRAVETEKDPAALAASREKLGDVLLASGREKEALAQYEAARRAMPGWFMPYAKVGAALVDRRPGEAEAWLRQAQGMIAGADEAERIVRARIDLMLAKCRLAL